jgi:hypothetical protein
VENEPVVFPTYNFIVFFPLINFVSNSWIISAILPVGERNWIQTRQSSKIECFIFSAHTGLTQALSTALGETTWIGGTAK